MNYSQRIWNHSKWRFLQSEASLWLLGTKFIDLVFISGIIVWFYFDNYTVDNIQYIKYVGVALIIISVAISRYRIGLYHGFFDCYEQGFMDGASGNCDSWSDSGYSEENRIEEALNEIDENEKRVSKENMEEREKEIIKGLKKFGWFRK